MSKCTIIIALIVAGTCAAQPRQTNYVRVEQPLLIPAEVTSVPVRKKKMPLEPAALEGTVAMLQEKIAYLEELLAHAKHKPTRLAVQVCIMIKTEEIPVQEQSIAKRFLAAVGLG